MIATRPSEKIFLALSQFSHFKSGLSKSCLSKFIARGARTALILSALLFLLGCADEGKDQEESLAIAGTWQDGFSTTHTIGDDSWVQTAETGSFSFTITHYDNDARFAIAQNGADNAFNPNLWSRFDWVYKSQQLYICQVAYSEQTAAAAQAAEAADTTDPATSGCGGFTWTALNAK